MVRVEHKLKDSAILQAMYELLFHHSHWCTGVLARQGYSPSSPACDPLDPLARAWSCPGAAIKVTGDPTAYSKVKGHLMAFAPSLTAPVTHEAMLVRLKGGEMHATLCELMGARVK